MSITRSRNLLCLAAFAALFIAATASAATPVGTEFNYQGRLLDGGVPADANYDLEFTLHSASAGAGNQVGATLNRLNTPVDDGLFQVNLDFGAQFAGDARWLETKVRPTSVGGYSTLSPRQLLRPAPYAIYAPAAGNAATAANANLLDSIDSTGFALTGHTHNYQGVVVVAKSGGNFTTLTAALASIVDATSINRYLIRVMPGIYDEQVTGKSFVDIEGSGELTTRIRFTGNSSLASAVTLQVANNSEVRRLTVESLAAGVANAVGIQSAGSGAITLTNVTALASGATGSNFGVNLPTPGSHLLILVNASATGGSTARGLLVSGSATPIVRECSVTASTSANSSTSYAIEASSTNNVALTNVSAAGSSSAAAGATTRGIFITSDDSVCENVFASASGGVSAIGLHTEGDDIIIRNTRALGTATAATAVSVGIFNLGEFAFVQHVAAAGSGGANSRGFIQEGAEGLVMLDTSAVASNAITNNYGIIIQEGDAFTQSSLFRNVRAVGVGTNAASQVAAGMLIVDSTPIIEDSRMEGRNSTTTVGVDTLAGDGLETSFIRVDRCTVVGNTNTMRIRVDCTLRVGASKLAGGNVFFDGGAPAAVFYANYDENYVNGGGISGGL